MPEKIVPVNLSQQFKDDYQRYAIYVTYDRIMTDIRDGFKPVQRRLVYSVLQAGGINHTVKSATIVGEAMKYHPHGDTSLASSIKPLTNWFECYIPIFTKQGNFGNIQGNDMAAPRYNEVRLSDFALEYVVGDMREASDSVNWVDNYDNTRKEPEFLSSALPLTLINGSFGIGVGKRIDVPAHNTNEVIDAMLTLMDNPKADIVLIPDTCQKCEIFDDANWKEISKTGFGFFTVRGIIETTMDFSNDHFKHRPAVIIRSIPDGVFLDTICGQVNNLIAKKKIIQIDGEFDDSIGDNLQYVYVLKQGTDPEYIKNVLYQNTAIQSNQRINFEMLNGLEVVRLPYKEYLLYFIEHRKKVKYRLFVNRLQQINTKLHEKEAFIKLLESGKIEEVIAKIRKYKKDQDMLIEYLINLLKVTDLQAKYIIDANLGNLTPAHLEKLKKERQDLYNLRDQYFALTTSDDAITEYLRQELLTIKAKYGCPRRSSLIHKSSAKDAIPTGPMVIAITEKGYIKKVPAGTTLGSFRNDTIKQIIEIDNADYLILFDGSGKVYRLLVNKLPFGDKNSNGTDLKFVFKTFSGNCVKAFPESILKKMRNKDKSSMRYHIISITKSGFIKKMELDEFMSIPSSGLLYAKMDSGDYVQDMGIAYSNCSILVFDDKRVMSIPANSLAVMKRAARGNKTLKSGNIDGMIIVNGTKTKYLVCVTKTGKINKVLFNSIPGAGEAKKEFSIIRLSKDDAIQNILCADDSNTLVIRCFNAGEFEFPIKDIQIGSSVSGGDKVLSLKNDQIIYSKLQ